jgi:hypothetical protein
MASLGTLENQMKNVESQLSDYDANLPSAIQGEIQKAYTPALERSLGTTKNLMSDYLGRYFDTTTMGPGMAGSTAKDLSPTQKLGVMGRELGTMSGQLQSSQQLSDYLGGQMTDMYNKAMTAAQMGQQNLADKYNRLSQQYQTALQVAEAEKDRQLQRSLSGGSGGNIFLGGGDGSEQPVSQGISPQDQKNLASLKTELSLIARIGAKNGITAQQRFEQARNIISGVIRSFPQIRNYINNKQAMTELFRAAGFSDRANPILINPQMAEQLVQMF